MLSDCFIDRKITLEGRSAIKVLLIGFFLLLVINASIDIATGDESKGENRYVTWEGLEPDRTASAWLIKRFINKKAVFDLLPEGSKIEKGIAFDVPESELARTHNESTYEVLLRRYSLDDAALKQIGEVINEIEIVSWRRPANSKSLVIEKELRDLQQQAEKQKKGFNYFFSYYDHWYKKLEKKKQ